MANEPGTLERIAQQFGLALAPLEVLLAPESFSTLLVELGLDTPPNLQADAAFLHKLSNTIGKAVALGPELENVALAADSGNDDDLISAVKQLLETILQLTSALDALATDFKRAATGLMDAAALEAFVEEMVERIFENVLVRYLESNYRDRRRSGHRPSQKAALRSFRSIPLKPARPAAGGLRLGHGAIRR
jgi:hypothetical protein